MEYQNFVFILTIMFTVAGAALYLFVRVSVIRPIWKIEQGMQDMRKENSASLLTLQEIAITAKNEAEYANRRLDLLEGRLSRAP